MNALSQTGAAQIGAPSPMHLDALTGIRGIAAWFVVFFHMKATLAALFPPVILAVFSKGYLAVDLFFVLSGFVMWGNYGERLRTGGIEQKATFLWRRFARIWPLHAVILSAFAALAVLLIVAGKASEDYPLAALPAHFLLVHNWGFSSELTWNDPSWSISTELAAYLVFPLFVVAARWERMSSLALLAVAAGLCGIVGAIYAAHGAHSIGDRIAQLGIWRCLAQFCLGNIACIVWMRWRDEPRAKLWALLGVGAIIASAAILRLPETFVVPALFFAAILALALDRGVVSRVLSVRPLLYLGEISYSTYLSHFLLFIVFKILFVDDSLLLGWASLAGFLVVLLAVSAGLYHGVEKPAQRWLNRRRPTFRSAVPAE